MRVVFINPTPGYGLVKIGEKVKRKAAGLYMPIGIALLATILEKHGHKCRALDLQVEQFTPEELVNELRRFKAEALCLSVLTPLVPEASRIAGLAKRELGIPVIAGGYHLSQVKGQFLEEYKDFDYIMIGEAEYTLLNLINALEKGLDPIKVEGIFFRRGGRIVGNPLAPVVDDLNKLPIASREFFDVSKYPASPNQYKRLPVANMITSRGCTYGLCTFCAESGRLARKYRRISVSRAIEEVKYLVDNYGIREIYFWDDEFILVKKWVHDFCNELKRENIDITWSCYAKVNYVDRALLENMASAGCWSVFYGAESGVQELLDSIKKDQTIEQIRQAVDLTHEAGMEARCSFMLGLPGETPEMGRRTIDFAMELGADYAYFLLTCPYPGTKMYEQIYGTGFSLQGTDLSKFTQMSPVYVPEAYEDAGQLRRFQNHAYRKFYMRPGYVLSRLKSIRDKDALLRHLRAIPYFFRTRFSNIGL